MSQTQNARAKFGPVALEVDTSTSNIWALMYVAFVTIGLVTGMAAMTPYVLTANLGIAESAQGRALGSLALWQEITLIFAYGPIGLLADRVGRRAVYAAGFITLAAGYAIYPYANSLTELSLAANRLTALPRPPMGGGHRAPARGTLWA